MHICIESYVLNHPRRSGLMTYTEGLVYGMHRIDKANQYTLAYYSLTRKPTDMPGPEGENFRKAVLKVPDYEFAGRQWAVDHIALPAFLKANKIRIFHRTAGYTMPSGKGIYRILTVHDLRTLTIGDEFWTQNIEHYKKTIGQLDMCVTVSECTKKDLITHLGIDEKKIKVIYLGADPRFKPSPTDKIEQVRRKYGINGPFLFSVGSVPRKNIKGIIQAFAGSKIKQDFYLVLSCNMDVDKYRKMAYDLGVESRLLILSTLTDEEVVALYSSCHCFFFPSLYEGFGLPILEAMQCGAPVITSNISSCPEVAGEAALFVDPRNVAEMSAAIDQMCQGEDLRRDFIQAGLKRSKLFNWDIYAQEMKKIYDLA